MSFRLKTIIGIAIIETILLLILIGSSLNFLKSSTEEELQKRAKTTAKLFATTTKDAVLSSDLASLESFVEEILSNAELEYARVLGLDDVMAQGGKKQLLEKSFREDVDYELIDDGIFDTYANITEEGEIYGRVEIGISVSFLQKSYQKALKQTFFIAGIELLLSALFSFLLGSILTKRLNVLNKATKVVAKGNYDYQIDIDGNDELSEVSHSFNKMVNNLNKSKIAEGEAKSQLQTLNKDLEEKVKTRTKDLEKAMLLIEEEKQKQIKVAYESGIAENAISVLHNIGNVITPAMVQTSLLREDHQLKSVAEYITKIKELLSTQLDQDNIEHFFKKDKRGVKVFPALEEIINNIEKVEINQKKATTTIEKHLSNISDIISAQQKYANFKIVNVDYSMAELIEDAIKFKKDTIEKSKVQISFNKESLKAMSGNKNRIMQIVLNLLVNSIESILERLLAEPEHQGKIDITLQGVDSDYYAVKIEDNGLGADQEIINNVFNFGFSTKKRGSGFGLHDCGNFILANKGKITLNSEGRLRGAVVYFELPYKMT